MNSGLENFLDKNIPALGMIYAFAAHYIYIILPFLFILCVLPPLILNSKSFLLKRARKGSLEALCKLSKKLIRGGDRVFRLQSVEVVKAARQGNMDAMKALAVLTGNDTNMHFRQDNEVSDLWSRMTGGSSRQAGMRIHEVTSQGDPREELNALIGLEEVKQAVNDIANRLSLFDKRKKANLPVIQPALHLIFLGNPGTGKTTVARILGRILHQLGYLSRGHVVEVSEADLIGQYVGETPIKVQGKIQHAIGGILFIDEAYSIAQQSGTTSYGPSAIAALVKHMEDMRGDVVVIAAGYPREMIKFMESNPGLRSRFTEVITFSDYSPEDMVKIYQHMAAQNGYLLNAEAKANLARIMGEVKGAFIHNFSNGRIVRNLFENTITALAARVARIKKPSKQDLMLIKKEDILDAFGKMKTAQAASGGVNPLAEAENA